METIKVNMTPCEDVQTIHASQNDNEGREWGFELHNNGEKIDSSSISDQLVFKAYEGGTEQILPTNGSTPTTSPFKGDIKYPQGLLSDQEFLYRESPTEEDGLAKITDIKGNTLVLNQLWDYENISFQQGLTVTKPGDGVYLINGTRATAASGDAQNILKSGHKYLIKSNTDNGTIVVTNSITWGTTQATYILNATADGMFTYFINPGTYTNVKFIPQVIDLTLMFGQGNEPSTVEEFTSLFPLSYYAYNQGTLLSFMGNGIKTVGKNLLKLVDKSGTYNGITYSCADNVITLKGTANGASIIDFSVDGGFLRLYPRFQYTKGLSPTGTYSNVQTSLRGQNADFVTVGFWTNNALPLTMSNLDADAYYFRVQINSGFTVDCTLSVQLEIGNVATDYEPYTSSTLSLPISTYFSNGMKSAGSVYDELTETKAITRIGSVDLGSFDWSYNEQYQCFITYPVLTDSADVNTTSVPNFISIYKAVSWSVGATDATQDMIVCFLSSAHQLRVRNKSFTDPTAFKTAMNGVYLYYELATPTETSFTTASLVTENAEIPLSNEDGVLIGKCTEQLSSESGFFDAKIKLSDSDGDVYSNKIQLHIERSPQ